MKKAKVSALLLVLCLAVSGTMTVLASEVSNTKAQQTETESKQEKTEESAEKKEGEEVQDSQESQVSQESQEAQTLQGVQPPTDENVLSQEGAADENGFVIEDGVLTKYQGNAADVVVPEGVTSIGERAFEGPNNIVSVTLPEGVREIGANAFMNCKNMVTITLPEGLTYIGAGAFFSNVALKNINIPNSVTKISEWAFQSCEGLEVITIPSANIGESAFWGCISLKSVTLSDGVTSIGNHAFFNVPGVVKIPNSVTSIGLWAEPFSFSSGNQPAFPPEVVTTICAKKDSYAQKYASEKGIPFMLWGDDGSCQESGQKPVYTITLTDEQTIFSSRGLENLVKINQTQDVVIQTPSGVVFTFAKGTMKMIDGKKEYDFGTEIITDYAKVGKIPFTSEETVFRVNYNYEGELPGTAVITIPVDAKWNGKTLYYYQIVNDEKVEFMQSAVVSDGTYMISQNHCSDYVASTKDSVSQNSAEAAPKTMQKASPKTGDSASIIMLISMMGASGIVILKGFKKN